MSDSFNRSETEADRMEAAHHRRLKEIHGKEYEEPHDKIKYVPSTKSKEALHALQEEGRKLGSFFPSADRGFHHSDALKAAEELRMEGKGSHDPHYENSKKNK